MGGGNILKGLLTLLLVFTCMAGYSQSKPEAPVNLKLTKQDGTLVSLSWERKTEGKTLLFEGFEGDKFLPDGWTADTTNHSFYAATWFQYPTDDFTVMDGWEMLVYEGSKSAVVWMDVFDHVDPDYPYTQNETLITPNVENAAYLEFYCWIDPHILEYGAAEEFPDHYYVKVSYDDGQTWKVLWDARYNSDPNEGWQKVVLALGTSPTGKTKVAFQSMGTQDPEQNMNQYFTWAIDNVKITDAPVAAQEAPRQMRPMVSKPGVTYREFTPKNPIPAAIKRAPQHVKSEAQKQAEALTSSYRVYLDDKLIAQDLTRMNYTDATDKASGKHIYKVTAYSEEAQTESDPAELEVVLPEFTTLPPRNFKIATAPEEGGETYTVTITWDAPEGERLPQYYLLYSNGTFFGMMQPSDGNKVEQTMVRKGVHEYAIEAQYANPEGYSERLSEQVALGTRFPAYNVTATIQGEDVVMTWEAPKASEFEMGTYSVYRGNDEIATGLTTMTHTDANAPKGKYEYSVKAVYKDGFVALPQTVIVDNGEMPVQAMPFEEDFTGGLTPGNWSVERMSGMKPNYQWRFDNYYSLDITGEGFDADFASINSAVSGFTNIMCALTTPPISNTVSAGNRIYLTFAMEYQTVGQSVATIEMSTDGGLNWIEHSTLTGYAPEELEDGKTCKPTTCKIDLTNSVGDAKSFMLRWKYSGFREKHLAIDNVKVFEDKPDAIADATAADGDITITTNGGKIFVNSQGANIEEAAIYSLSGACTAKVENQGSRASLNIGRAAVYIVKVKTAEGTKTQKLVIR